MLQAAQSASNAAHCHTVQHTVQQQHIAHSAAYSAAAADCTQCSIIAVQHTMQQTVQQQHIAHNAAIVSIQCSIIVKQYTMQHIVTAAAAHCTQCSNCQAVSSSSRLQTVQQTVHHCQAVHKAVHNAASLSMQQQHIAHNAAIVKQ